MTIVRLPLILAVLGIAALLASACSESGRVELPAEAAVLSEVKKLTASDAQADASSAAMPRTARSIGSRTMVMIFLLVAASYIVGA